MEKVEMNTIFIIVLMGLLAVVLALMLSVVIASAVFNFIWENAHIIFIGVSAYYVLNYL